MSRKLADFPKRRGRRGIALVAVLWGLTLLALVAANFTRTTRTEVRLAYSLLESAKAEALAEAGVHRTILSLAGFEDGEDGAWRVDGSVYGWRFGDGEIRVSVRDEGGKIDLNLAQEDLLGALFRSLELERDQAEDLVGAIVDYRDPDDLRHQNGAEDPEYERAGLLHDAKDAPFQTIEELLQVYGMTQAIYRRVAPAVTIYSSRPTPATDVAPPEVRALFGDPALQADLEDLPPESDEILDLETEAPTPSGPLGDEALSEVEGGDSGQPVLLRRGPSPGRSGVPVYTIHVEARAASGAIFALETVVQIPSDEGEAYEFLTWRRAERSLFDDGASGAAEADS